MNESVSMIDSAASETGRSTASKVLRGRLVIFIRRGGARSAGPRTRAFAATPAGRSVRVLGVQALDTDAARAGVDARGLDEQEGLVLVVWNCSGDSQTSKISISSSP